MESLIILEMDIARMKNQENIDIKGDGTDLSEMKEFKGAYIIDFPPGVSSELKRLHEIIEDNGGSVNKENRLWAMHKIDVIHKSYFIDSEIK